MRAFRLAVGAVLAAAIFAVLGVASAGATVTPSFSASDVTTCTGSTPVTVTVDAQNPPPVQQAADIVLVVDDSGSIGSAVFDTQVRPSLTSFVNWAAPSTAGNHIGIAKFSSNAVNVTGGLLGNATVLNSMIAGMLYTSGNTSTLSGMTLANTMLSGTGSRAGAPKVMIVETDGVWNPSTQNPTAFAANLRSQGVELFAVGVGAQVSTAQLQAIAGGDATHVFTAATYSQLESQLEAALQEAVPAATTLTYTVDAAPDWSISGASASAGTVTPTATGFTWSLDKVSSSTPTTVTISYTETHTGSTNGTKPLASTATLAYTDDTGSPQSVDYSGETVNVSGCNRAPTAAIVPVGSVQLNGSPTATVSFDGSGSSDPDNDALTYAWTFDSGASNVTGADTATPSADFGLGSHTAHLTVSDGSLSSSADVTFDVYDPTPPVVTGHVTGSQTNGWYTGTAVVTFTVDDPESAIATTSGDCAGTTVTGDTAGMTFTCTATSAGPGSGSDSVFVKRDATGPSIVIGGNAVTYGVGDTVDITCTASDALSGLASPVDCGGISGAAYTFGAGLHTVTRTATDNAGNTSPATITFTVAVDAAGICSLVQQWSDNAGVANSLCTKLAHGSTAAFRNELAAQRGKHLPAAKADILLGLAQGL